MKKYIGTKTVMAEPMNEFKAVELGYARPNEDHHEWREGYHVSYPDNYHSWSPKDVFEASYKCAETFLDRLLIEHAELRAKVIGLKEFLYSKPFNELSKFQQKMLVRQFSAMTSYLECLDERLSDLTAKECNPKIHLQEVNFWKEDK